MTPELEKECEEWLAVTRKKPFLTQKDFDRAHELHLAIFAEHCTECFDQYVKEYDNAFQL